MSKKILKCSEEETNRVIFKCKRRKHNAKPLNNFFEYSMENDCKMGKCKLCAPDKDVIIRMKDTNTTGVIRHLRGNHPEIYVETYPNKKLSSTTKREVTIMHCIMSYFSMLNF